MMKLTKDERRGVADALMRAKNHLWDGTSTCLKQEYICHALEAIVNRYVGSTYVYSELAKAIILKRIYPSVSLENWLDEQPGVRLYKIPNRSVFIQQHRLAWMNMLIREFSK